MPSVLPHVALPRSRSPPPYTDADTHTHSRPHRAPPCPTPYRPRAAGCLYSLVVVHVCPLHPSPPPPLPRAAITSLCADVATDVHLTQAAPGTRTKDPLLPLHPRLLAECTLVGAELLTVAVVVAYVAAKVVPKPKKAVAAGGAKGGGKGGKGGAAAAQAKPAAPGPEDALVAVSAYFLAFVPDCFCSSLLLFATVCHCLPLSAIARYSSLLFAIVCHCLL
jgi:hypothetical protein